MSVVCVIGSLRNVEEILCGKRGKGPVIQGGLERDVSSLGKAAVVSRVMVQRAKEISRGYGHELKCENGGPHRSPSNN